MIFHDYAAYAGADASNHLWMISFHWLNDWWKIGWCAPAYRACGAWRACMSMAVIVPSASSFLVASTSAWHSFGVWKSSFGAFGSSYQLASSTLSSYRLTKRYQARHYHRLRRLGISCLRYDQCHLWISADIHQWRCCVSSRSAARSGACIVMCCMRASSSSFL